MNGQASYTAPAGPSSSFSAVGDHQQSSQSQVQKNHLPDGQHAAVVCDHLWQHGWQRGEYSDVEVRVRDRPYQLHRIILSKSPYMDYLLKVTPRGQPIWIPVPDDPMFEEAMAIVFGYLYASHVLSSINAANARSVLTVATAFGMNDLCTHAYDVCRQSITADTIQEWVEWIDLQEPKSDQISASTSRASTPVSLPADARQINGTDLVHPSVDRDRMNFGTAPSIDATASTQVYGNVQKPRGTTSPNGWKDVFSQSADNYVTQLKRDIYTYLIIQLPEDLRQLSPSLTLNDNPRYTDIFTRLPFDLFKACIEDPQLDLGTDQERFAFAKAMIQQRKRKPSLKAASGHADAASVVENVVLRFGGDVGTKVHITRKSKQRALWKVEKE